ncbi:alpha/beta hydrolase [Oxalobacteraceae bacterium A2-2]
MTQLSFDTQALDEARGFNRRLALLPRFKVRNRYTPLLVQSLLKMSQVGGGRNLARQGVTVERRVVATGGVRVPVRILRPPGEVRGVVLDFHGGGWVIGNAQMDDPQNAALALACQVAVVSVDYRLAVFIPIQGIMDDCLAAARWLLDSEEPVLAGLPVIVVGESAGGHLAAATLLRLKAWPELLRRVRGAVLYYGVYDLAGTASVRQAGADTLVLDGPGMVEGLRLLTPGMSDEQRRQPPLSPLYGDWTGMPPALLFAGELDPLRDDTVELAQRWGRCAEVEVQLPPEAPHGFIRFPLRMARQVLAHSHAWILRKL